LMALTTKSKRTAVSPASTIVARRFALRPVHAFLPMIGTITNPATGSAHQPNKAFRSKPPSRIADGYVQKSACLESAFMALLPILAATGRFARASSVRLDHHVMRGRFLAATGRFARASSAMTTMDTAATMMPGVLRSGDSCRIRRGRMRRGCTPPGQGSTSPRFSCVIRSTCSRREGFRSWWNRHNSKGASNTKMN